MKQLIFSILLSLPILAFSQEEAKFFINFDQEPLDSAFERIETIFDVRFSYDDASVSEKNISLPREERSLDQVLLALETLTGLTFEIIENRYIIVNKSSDEVNIQELERIVLTTYLTKGIQKQKDASYEISPLKLGILPGLTEPDVLESIQLLPGVVSPNETASGFMVRGGKMDQNRLIWDGINMYHKGHLFGMISPFNPNATRKVTFINKGTHARYGERASSVVLMETSTEIQDELNGQIGINGINADAYIEAPIIKDKLGIQASLRKSYTNLFRSYTFDQLTEKVFRSTKIEEDDNGDDDFDFLDYNVKINFKPNENNEILGSIISIDNALDYTVSDDNTLEEFNDILDISNDGYSLTWNKIWNSTLTQQTSAFYSEYNLDYNFITNENDAQVSDFEKRNSLNNITFVF